MNRFVILVVVVVLDEERHLAKLHLPASTRLNLGKGVLVWAHSSTNSLMVSTEG